RKRQVQVESRAGRGSQLIGIAREVGEGVGGVAVQRNEEHVRAIIENILSAVAVVKIDIEDGNACRARVAQVLRSDRGIVQEAVAAVQIVRRVMPRRAAQRKG